MLRNILIKDILIGIQIFFLSKKKFILFGRKNIIDKRTRILEIVIHLNSLFIKEIRIKKYGCY
jgi:hypothetical protein